WSYVTLDILLDASGVRSMNRLITARGRMTRPTCIQTARATFSKRYATNCRSALRTCAMMQQGGSTESKMDQVRFLRGTDNAQVDKHYARDERTSFDPRLDGAVRRYQRSHPRAAAARGLAIGCAGRGRHGRDGRRALSRRQWREHAGAGRFVSRDRGPPRARPAR